MSEFRATIQYFSPVIIELDAATRSGRIQHDGNPVLEWCLGNVVAKADRRGNLYPTKQRPEQKIDAAVALIMAVGRAMTDDGWRPDSIASSPVRSLLISAAAAVPDLSNANCCAAGFSDETLAWNGASTA